MGQYREVEKPYLPCAFRSDNDWMLTLFGPGVSGGHHSVRWLIAIRRVQEYFGGILVNNTQVRQADRGSVLRPNGDWQQDERVAETIGEIDRCV